MTNEPVSQNHLNSAAAPLVGTDIFELLDSNSYALWRKEKLHNYPNDIQHRMVHVADPSAPSSSEKSKIFDLCRKTNMAFYSVTEKLTKVEAMVLANSFGLQRLDIPLFTDEPGVTEITRVGEGRQGEYAPYTNRSLSWHTDGYYNPIGSEVRGMLLHCEQSAKNGGETALLDPEIAYIYLRDENPDYIDALMQPDAYTVHANIEDGKIIRPAQTAPVFSVIEGHLHMRFSARKRYIDWKADPLIDQAGMFLEEILNDSSGPVIHHTLSAGQGLICNNVLHMRTVYEDKTTSPRLLYRARFSNRVTNPVFNLKESDQRVQQHNPTERIYNP